MASTRDFKTKEGYRKWLAFGHISGVFEEMPRHQNVTIKGRRHRVKHA